MKLKDITTPKLTQIMQSYNLNPATVRKLYVIIQSIFKRGMEQGFLRDNPCHNVILPKNKEQHKVMALTEDELKRFVKMLDEKPCDEDVKRECCFIRECVQESALHYAGKMLTLRICQFQSSIH